MPTIPIIGKDDEDADRIASTFSASDPPLDFEGRGTARSAVEGRERSERSFQRGRSALSRRPSTSLRVVPLPCKSRGGLNGMRAIGPLAIIALALAIAGAAQASRGTDAAALAEARR